MPELSGNIGVQLLSDSGAKMAGSKEGMKSQEEGRQTVKETEKKPSPQTEEKVVKKMGSEIKTSKITPVKAKTKVPEQKKTIKKKAPKKKVAKKKLIKKTPNKAVKKVQKAKKKTVKKKIATPSKNDKSSKNKKNNIIKQNTGKQGSGQRTKKPGTTKKSQGKSSDKTASNKKVNGSGEKIISGEKVQIISQVKPAYPRISRKRKEEGTVVLLVRVKSGRVSSLEIEKSSGHDRLDRSAVKALKRWKFDRSVTATVRIPVIFSLKK